MRGDTGGAAATLLSVKTTAANNDNDATTTIKHANLRIVFRLLYLCVCVFLCVLCVLFFGLWVFPSVHDCRRRGASNAHAPWCTLDLTSCWCLC